MKLLTLLRHAKSSWRDSSLADYDRPLNGRGKAAAPQMASYMQSIGLMPDHIAISGAKRTRQTFKRVQQAWPELATPKPVFSDDLYHASATQLMAFIHHLPTSSNHALLCGHNPGLNVLINTLSGQAANNLATAGVAVLLLDIESWQQVVPGCAQLELFVVPKQLAQRDRQRDQELIKHLIKTVA